MALKNPWGTGTLGESNPWRIKKVTFGASGWRTLLEMGNQRYVRVTWRLPPANCKCSPHIIPLYIEDGNQKSPIFGKSDLGNQARVAAVAAESGLRRILDEVAS